jgi:putative endopeptidase
MVRTTRKKFIKRRRAHSQTVKKRQGVLPAIPQVPSPLTSKKPGFDFFEYVNGAWLKKTKIPENTSSFGVSEELDAAIDKQIDKILKKSIQFAKLGKKPQGLHEVSMDLVGRLGLSALRPRVQNENIKYLKKLCKHLGCIRDLNDLSTTFSEFARYRITSLFSVTVYYEPGKKPVAKPYLCSGGLGLPNASYYKEAPGKSKMLLDYGKLLDQLSKELETEKLSTVIPLERFIADKTDMNEIIIRGSELAELCPSIQWEIFWTNLDVPEWKVLDIKIDSKEWLRQINTAIKKFSFDDWKAFFTTHVVLHSLRVLPHPFDTLYFDFFEKGMRGQKRPPTRRELTIDLLKEWAPNSISYLYAELYIPKSLKSEIRRFVKEIQNAAVNRIQNSEWMSPPTKKKAIEKVEGLRLDIGSPDSFPNLPKVDLQTDTLLQNILLLGEEYTLLDMRMVGKEVDVNRYWDDVVYSTNAHYYTETNQMILPAGSFTWPFYHEAAPIGWNYGGLGAVISHEITHAFDMDGMKYSVIGEKKNWWTTTDLKKYKKIASRLVERFGKARVLGHPVNGSLTLDENISDLGGLAIALDALKMDLIRRKASVTQEKEAYRNFFLSYAVSWRVKDSPERALQRLFMDRHAPTPLRVNYVVNQFDEWYEIFEIQVADELYLPPEERIRIF